MAKKYYWLKMKEDFFRKKEMKKIRKIAGGDTYTIIYLKMLLLSLKNDGLIHDEGIEDTFAADLSLEIDEEVDNINIALKLFEKMNLIEIIETDVYKMSEIDEMVGSECDSAKRVRAHRNKKMLQCNTKTLQCNSDVTKCNTEIERELDLDLDLELEKRVREEKDICVSKDTRKRSKAEYSEDFEQFWAIYPRRIGKVKAYKAWNKLLKEKVSVEDLLKAASNYQRSKRGEDEKFIKHASTFLGINRDFEDYINFVEVSSGKAKSLKEDLLEWATRGGDGDDKNGIFKDFLDIK